MVNTELLNYILECQEKGISKDDISKTLLSNGWDLSSVQEGFDSLKIDDQISAKSIPGLSFFSANKHYILFGLLGVILGGFIFFVFIMPKMNSDVLESEQIIQTNNGNNSENKDSVIPVAIEDESSDQTTYENPYPDKFCAMLVENPDPDLIDLELITISDIVTKRWSECSKEYGFNKDQEGALDLLVDEMDKEFSLKYLKVSACMLEKNKNNNELSILNNQIAQKIVNKQEYDSCIATKSEQEKTEEYKTCATQADSIAKRYSAEQCPPHTSLSYNNFIDCSNKEQLISYGLLDKEAEELVKNKSNHYEYFYMTTLIGCFKEKM